MSQTPSNILSDLSCVFLNPNNSLCIYNHPRAHISLNWYVGDSLLIILCSWQYHAIYSKKPSAESKHHEPIHQTMSSMHMGGPYITVGCVSLDKTFGGSLTQPTKSQFISQAALTSHGADMIHNIQCIQPFDKLV